MSNGSTETSSVPFHTQIEALREERGLTKQEVADAVGITLRAYSEFSRGRLKDGPQPATRRALREFFGMDQGTATRSGSAPNVSLEDEDLPADIQQFRNFVAAFLLTMPEEERLAFMYDETRRWLAIRTGQQQ